MSRKGNQLQLYVYIYYLQQTENIWLKFTKISKDAKWLWITIYIIYKISKGIWIRVLIAFLKCKKFVSTERQSPLSSLQGCPLPPSPSAHMWFMTNCQRLTRCISISDTYHIINISLNAIHQLLINKKNDETAAALRDFPCGLPHLKRQHL